MVTGGLGWHANVSPSGRLQGTFILISKLATLVALAVAVSGSIALSSQPVEAKTSRSGSLKARNILVPPPPPYIPTIIPGALGMLSDTQAITSDADNAFMEKEAKTSRHSSHRSRNYFVPPPPPYAPSIVVSALGMTNTQPAAANDAMLEKSVDSYSKYLMRHQGDMPAQIGGPNTYLTSVSAYLRVEKKVHKEIDQFDSEISNHEKEIGRLLNL